MLHPLYLTTISISAWAFVVYSCERVFQYLCLENKQSKVPRLSLYTNGLFGTNNPQ